MTTETQERMALNVSRLINTNRKDTPFVLSDQRDAAMQHMLHDVVEIAKGVNYDPVDVQQKLVDGQIQSAEDIANMARMLNDSDLMGVACKTAVRTVDVAPEMAAHSVKMMGDSLSAEIKTAINEALVQRHHAAYSQRQH